MRLADYQRALVRLSFASEPDAADVAALGDAERFGLYRHMIRTRFVNMAKVAFQGTLELVGEQIFFETFARYLAASPPHSPLIREVIADFGPFARMDAGLVERAACLGDLLRFEETKWRVAYQPATFPRAGEGGVRELDFEGVPVLNPTLRALSLAHAVHEREGTQCRAAPLTLLVYRPPGIDEVRWYAADPFFAGLLVALDRPRSLAELVPQVAQDQQRAVDEQLLDALATAITLALTRGVLLGVRD